MNYISLHAITAVPHAWSGDLLNDELCHVSDVELFSRVVVLIEHLPVWLTFILEHVSDDAFEDSSGLGGVITAVSSTFEEHFAEMCTFEAGWISPEHLKGGLFIHHCFI